ncbi:MAG TPA: precorrin-6A reductase [Desulfitobacteriaceae bacterium]|nr:precorrin-6A reductase [Desulfitobacteriaceae bacterium]
MIFLLGETAAAREIASILATQDIQFTHLEIREHLVRIIQPSGEYQKDKSFSELQSFLSAFECRAVVDAAHPSRGAVFAPLRQLCEQWGIPYVRMERPETRLPDYPLIYPVASWEEGLLCLENIAEELVRKENRRSVTVFVTTGSHQLESLTQRAIKRNIRLVVRILPQASIVQKCQNLGIPPRDIVAMQGPFSRDLNRNLFKFYGSDVLLTRDSGRAGGTDTKISAALSLGLRIILLKKLENMPGQIFYAVDELLEWLQKNYLKTE